MLYSKLPSFKGIKGSPRIYVLMGDFEGGGHTFFLTFHRGGDRIFLDPSLGGARIFYPPSYEFFPKKGSKMPFLYILGVLDQYTWGG